MRPLSTIVFCCVLVAVFARPQSSVEDFEAELKADEDQSRRASAHPGMSNAEMFATPGPHRGTFNPLHHTKRSDDQEEP
ncbi:hypothetical protein Y032_0010g918 [Ancylostoma ceylanicum]|uniref:Uncharacterized protein n=1 Tax=Ancylostoma ceylanicum TaxID=53326 RepID=A0A016VI52_9BILA|nr:hypothetical protein Y032_0010g918 [Ancylostoma ceylanicum]